MIDFYATKWRTRGATMDDQIIEVYRQLVLRMGVSVDDILEDPLIRTTYLAEVRRAILMDLPERTLLHRLVTLRKTSRLPRSRELLARLDLPSVSE
jgi:hypothetical protein